MLIPLLLLLSLVFSFSGELQASKSKPDFTGTWNARILADPNAPTQLMKISYDDPRLEITRTLVKKWMLSEDRQSLIEITETKMSLDLN